MMFVCGDCGSCMRVGASERASGRKSDSASVDSGGDEKAVVMEVRGCCDARGCFSDSQGGCCCCCCCCCCAGTNDARAGLVWFGPVGRGSSTMIRSRRAGQGRAGPGRAANAREGRGEGRAVLGGGRGSARVSRAEVKCVECLEPGGAGGHRG
jgi:hypothetical protein